MDDDSKDCSGQQKHKDAANAILHGWCVVNRLSGSPRCVKDNGCARGCKGEICLVAIFDLDATPSVNVLCANPVDDNAWEWMLLKPDPSSAFNVEKEARRLENTPNAGPIAAQLFRAWNMQQTLLQQATNRIAALELQLMERDRQAGT